MSEHKRTITAISWCPHNPDMFASASADSLVIIWNVTEQKVVAKLDDTKGISDVEMLVPYSYSQQKIKWKKKKSEQKVQNSSKRIKYLTNSGICCH